MRPHRNTLIATLVLAVTFGLVACGSADDAGPTSSAPPPETAQPTPETVQPTPETDEPDAGSDDTTTDTTGTDLDKVTRAALAALDLAETEAGGQAFEIDDADDRSAWDIEVNAQGTEIDVTVNWAGTEIVSSRADGSVDSDTVAKLSGSTLTIQEGIHIAAAEASGSLEDAEVDRENGVIVWEVTFHDGTTDTDVYVDANTGEVLKVD